MEGAGYIQCPNICLFTSAEQELMVLTGPISVYERWIQWESTTAKQSDTQLLVEELNRMLAAEPVSTQGRMIQLYVCVF